MRINIYTEELETRPGFPITEIVTAEYISSRTGQPMKNWGLRIYIKSHPALHYIPGRDDDRSAITFWCGENEKNIFEFLDRVRAIAYAITLDTETEQTEKTREGI